MTINLSPVKSLCLFITLLWQCVAYSQTADFTFSASGGTFCSPSNVQFNATAPGAPIGYIWDFGNGQNANSASTTTNYSTAGSYTVKLTVVYQDSARDVQKVVLINPAASAFATQDRNYICKPGVVNFSASGSAGLRSYAWDFGDGGSSTAAIPSIAHNYAAMGNYTAKVIVTDSNGCTASATTQIRVSPPNINASISQRDGCIPAIVNYSANVDLPIGGSVTSYTWSFGDGVSSTTTVNSASHPYNYTGSYNPSLSIVTNEGCTNSSNYGTIAFGIPPTNTVAYLLRDTICASNYLFMIGKADSANKYHWDFGDGSTTDITDTLTSHKYTSLGSKTIKMTPSYNGCRSADTTLNVYVTGVIASYTFANSCLQRNTFTFNSTSVGSISSYRWDLGDNTNVNNVTTFQHSYSSPGSYQSSLIIYDSATGCADTARRTVNYATPTLTASDTLLCKGSKVTFTINNNFPTGDSRYEWDIVGDHFGPIPESVITDYRPRYLGVFYNQVVIDNGAGYCKDTIKMVKPVRVRGPKMDFAMPGSICASDSLQVVNNTTPYYPEDTIRLYYWNMALSNSNDTIFQPKPYRYNPGNYNIKSYATDKNGCADSLTKQLGVNAVPFVSSFPIMDTACLGQTKRLFAFHSDSLYWLPIGQVSCANCDTTYATPTTTTNYVAVAINSNGCKNYDTSLVKVFTPFTAIPTFEDTAFCLNDSARLGALPAGKKIVWQPASGLSSTNVYNPWAFPSQSTQYMAILTDSADCFTDTTHIDISIIQPPQVDAGPTKVYPYYATFIMQPTYSSNVVSYNWTPSALLNCTTCAVPTGRNDFSQTYTVTVVSDSGCVAKDSVKILVECRDSYLLMPTAFTPDNNGLNDYLFPLTRGISVVKFFAVYNRTGQLMYKAENFAPNNQSFGWDGRFNGSPQPNGAYVYILKALCDEGQELMRKGSFMLLR